MAPDLSHPDNAELIADFRESRTPLPDGTFTYPVRFSDADRVHGGLWMGGWPPPSYRVGDHFDCLVLCAREYQVPDLFGRVQVAQARLDDSGVPMRLEERPEAIRAAGKVVRWLRQDLRVLVTCFAGRNRSGLVSAIALCKGPAAMDPDAAIAAIRAARGDSAFRNPWFEAFLRAYCAPR